MVYTRFALSHSSDFCIWKSSTSFTSCRAVHMYNTFNVSECIRSALCSRARRTGDHRHHRHPHGTQEAHERVKTRKSLQPVSLSGIICLFIDLWNHFSLSLLFIIYVTIAHYILECHALSAWTTRNCWMHIVVKTQVNTNTRTHTVRSPDAAVSERNASKQMNNCSLALTTVHCHHLSSHSRDRFNSAFAATQFPFCWFGENKRRYFRHWALIKQQNADFLRDFSSKQFLNIETKPNALFVVQRDERHPSRVSRRRRRKYRRNENKFGLCSLFSRVSQRSRFPCFGSAEYRWTASSQVFCIMEKKTQIQQLN